MLQVFREVYILVLVWLAQLLSIIIICSVPPNLVLEIFREGYIMGLVWLAQSLSIIVICSVPLYVMLEVLERFTCRVPLAFVCPLWFLGFELCAFNICFFDYIGFAYIWEGKIKRNLKFWILRSP